MEWLLEKELITQLKPLWEGGTFLILMELGQGARSLKELTTKFVTNGKPLLHQDTVGRKLQRLKQKGLIVSENASTKASRYSLTEAAGDILLRLGELLATPDTSGDQINYPGNWRGVLCGKGSLMILVLLWKQALQLPDFKECCSLQNSNPISLHTLKRRLKMLELEDLIQLDHAPEVGAYFLTTCGEDLLRHVAIILRSVIDSGLQTVRADAFSLTNSPINVLKMRLAKGEISKKEFLARRKLIEE